MGQMVYVYAIFDAAGARALGPDVRGIDDQPAMALAHGNVAAAFSVHQPNSIRPTAENVWRHEQVVEQFMSDGAALLPARFRTVFPDEGALAATLAKNGDQLAAGLERVRGCVELGLRVLWKPQRAGQDGADSKADTDPPASGREYLIARLVEERLKRGTRERAERLADAVHSLLAATSAAQTRRVLPTPEMLLTAAYLVPRGNLADFRRRVNELTTAHRDLRLLCTGPWPPYHFVPEINTRPEIPIE